MAIIVLAGLSAIPQEMYKASIIDGANSWQRFRFIVLPLLLPVLGVAILFRAIDALRIFDLVYVLTGGGPGGSTETLSVYAYKLFFYKGDFWTGCSRIGNYLAIGSRIWLSLYEKIFRKRRIRNENWAKS